MKTLSAAILLIASNAWAQRVITPAPSPLKSYIVKSPAVLSQAVAGLSLPAQAAAAMRAAGAELLSQGPVLVLAVPEARQAALLTKPWEGPAAVVSWKNGIETARPNNPAALNRIDQTLEAMGKSQVIDDSWANRALFNAMFDMAKIGTSYGNPTIEARYDVPGAVAVATGEGVTRSRGGGGELRSWNKKTGRMFKAAIPDRYHYYLLYDAPRPKALPNGKVLAQFWTHGEKKAALGVYAPRRGTLKLLKGNARDISLATSYLHPDGRRLIYVRGGGRRFTPKKTFLGALDLGTGKRREVLVERKLIEPSLIKLTAGGRRALIAEGVGYDFRWLTIDLKSGKILSEKLPDGR